MTLPEENARRPGDAFVRRSGAYVEAECCDEDGTTVNVPDRGDGSEYDALVKLTRECNCGAPFHRKAKR